MFRNLDNLARAKTAYVHSDGAGFRRAARTLQSIWREGQGLPMGEARGVPLGSRLPVDLAKRELANYLSDGIKGVVRQTLADADGNQLFARPRIYNDLLSSQPLCFNLFGELKLDFELATRVLQTLRPRTIAAVTALEFEYSPQRSSIQLTGDRSAFDVFIEYRTQRGTKGFLGIEVKYHEDMVQQAAAHRPRYNEVATIMGCFEPGAISQLCRAPLQQLWRDHLLAGSMVADPQLGYDEGIFVLVFPAANQHCRAALQRYRSCLSNTTSFDAWTLEEFVAILSLFSEDEWIERFRTRYLDFTQLQNL